MIASLAKFLDWSAIQATTLMMVPGDAQTARVEEAVKFLKGPQFVPEVTQPARVEFDSSKSGFSFHFRTPQSSGLTENDIVYGRLYRCCERWQEKPVVILLHGAGDFPNYYFRFPRIARRFNRAGVNVATLVAPYHFQRRPRQPGAMAKLDCLMLVQATGQAIAEIRALTGWLLGEGCPAVALWGYSLGAWHAGIAACRDTRLNSAVLVAPAVRMNPWMEQRAIRPRVRRRLQEVRSLCEVLNLTPLNLLTAKPVIPNGGVLLVEGIYDLLVPQTDVEELWQTWEQPEIWRLPHGHVGVCCGGALGLTDRLVRWLAQRLDRR
jgi:pimeloyl-ACP methyl ester carboxylesterase